MMNMHGVAPENHRAMEQMIFSYRSYLLAIASRRLEGHQVDGDAASDFVQNTLGNALRAIRAGDCPEDCDELKRFLRNRLRDEFKKVFRRPRLVLVPLDEAVAEDLSSPSQVLQKNLRLRRLSWAKESLNLRDQQLITWCYDEKLGYAEIARRLGCSPTYARKLCHQVVQKLKVAMQEGSTA